MTQKEVKHHVPRRLLQALQQRPRHLGVHSMRALTAGRTGRDLAGPSDLHPMFARPMRRRVSLPIVRGLGPTTRNPTTGVVRHRYATSGVSYWASTMRRVHTGCLACGQLLPEPSAVGGRPRSYCDNRCKLAARRRCRAREEPRCGVTVGGLRCGQAASWYITTPPLETGDEDDDFFRGRIHHPVCGSCRAFAWTLANRAYPGEAGQTVATGAGYEFPLWICACCGCTDRATGTPPSCRECRHCNIDRGIRRFGYSGGPPDRPAQRRRAAR